MGLAWAVPDFSTLSRRQKTLDVNVLYRGSKGPMDVLIDSTGIKVEGEGEWHARKHGGPKRRVWRMIHLGIDEETLEVRAVEITGSYIGDASILPDLLNQIPAHEQICSVTADGAYDTRKCHDAIAGRGAHAVIPPRKNAKPWKTVTVGAVTRNETLRASKYLGRALWQRWSGIPPSKPRRNEDALSETAGIAPHGKRLRSTGRGASGPYRRSERRHRARRPCHRAHGISLSGERGTSALSRYVQQSPSATVTLSNLFRPPMASCANLGSRWRNSYR